MQETIPMSTYKVSKISEMDKITWDKHNTFVQRFCKKLNVDLMLGDSLVGAINELLAKAVTAAYSVRLPGICTFTVHDTANGVALRVSNSVPPTTANGYFSHSEIKYQLAQFMRLSIKDSRVDIDEYAKHVWETYVQTARDHVKTYSYVALGPLGYVQCKRKIKRIDWYIDDKLSDAVEYGLPLLATAEA